ncbi:MAG: hypothetical protein DRI77_00125 [Chloroflexi bacterium]|nr:MAG: hypothetical protein B6I35_12575 [Anaerolineaceae bacterium 4572_32.2]RLD00619.1 MAG: hypothetical protein DRI77_00125 [Chloroflexota bacterium]
MTISTTTAKRRINVTFPVEVLKLVDAVVRPRERNQFIVQAAEEAARREQLRKALDASAGAWKLEDYPELATPEDVNHWIRQLREYGHSSYDWDTQLAEDMQDEPLSS